MHYAKHALSSSALFIGVVALIAACGTPPARDEGALDVEGGRGRHGHRHHPGLLRGNGEPGTLPPHREQAPHGGHRNGRRRDLPGEDIVRRPGLPPPGLPTVADELPPNGRRVPQGDPRRDRRLHRGRAPLDRPGAGAARPPVPRWRRGEAELDLPHAGRHHGERRGVCGPRDPPQAHQAQDGRRLRQGLRAALPRELLLQGREREEGPLVGNLRRLAGGGQDEGPVLGDRAPRGGPRCGGRAFPRSISPVTTSAPSSTTCPRPWITPWRARSRTAG